jgi:hypothetical protein
MGFLPRILMKWREIMYQEAAGVIYMRFWWIVPLLVGFSKSVIEEGAAVYAIHITPFF